MPSDHLLCIVYVLSNPAMPGLVKIGRTSNNDISARLSQLYTTGLPFPFQVEFACKVTNPEEVESALHIAFGPSRVNPRREFFQIEPAQAIAILKLLHTEDATEEVQQQADMAPLEDQAAADQFRSRRPTLNFEELGIPIGAGLQFTKGESSVVVSSPRKVRFGEDETSLTAVTKQLLGVVYALNPGPFWTYNGKTISQLYNETYHELS